jgi:hypothetical protein
MELGRSGRTIDHAAAGAGERSEVGGHRQQIGKSAALELAPVNCDLGLLATRPSLVATVGCKVLVRESAIRKWFNNFNLGLTNANMASITSGSEFTVISIKSARILRLDGLIQRFQSGIDTFEHLVDGHMPPLR